MRILHVANFSWTPSKRKRSDDVGRYYSMDRKIGNGLVRNGHCVWDFGHRDIARYLSPLGLGKRTGAGRMNDALIRIADVFKPDWLLLGHAELVAADTVAEIRRRLPRCRVSQWWVDPFAKHALPHLREKQPVLDAFFATTSPEYYRPLIAAKDAQTRRYYFPNIADSSVECGRAFDKPTHEYDVFFAGADAPERMKFLQSARAVKNAKVGIFGCEGRPMLSGADLPAAIGAAKMGLNLSRPMNAPLYSSDRLAQLAGNGCLVLTPRTPGMEVLFAENEVAYFDGEMDLRRQIEHYLANDDDWRIIARAGWTRAHEKYNERRVARFMEEATFGRDFSEEYEWLGL